MFNTVTPVVCKVGVSLGADISLWSSDFSGLLSLHLTKIRLTVNSQLWNYSQHSWSCSEPFPVSTYFRIALKSWPKLGCLRVNDLNNIPVLLLEKCRDGARIIWSNVRVGLSLGCHWFIDLSTSPVYCRLHMWRVFVCKCSYNQTDV